MPNRKDTSAKSFAPNWHIPWPQYHTEKKKKIIAHLKHCIYCKLINQCLTERIPQQKALHLTGTYLDQSTAEQGKKKTVNDHLKHCIYWKLINQCLTERIPQQKALRLTGIYVYLDPSTTLYREIKERKIEIDHLKHYIYCKTDQSMPNR